MKTLYLTALLLMTAGCGAESESTTSSTSTALPDRTSAAQETIPAEVMAQWSRSCALCHVDGEGGAPRVGDVEAWAPRLAQGEETLLQHTIEGFNKMPPLGYCMDCEEADFSQIIRFMGGES